MHISRAATSDAGRELAEQRFASGSQLAGLGVGVDRQRHRRAMDVPCGDDVHRVPVIEHEASRAQLTRVSRPRIPPLSTARLHRRCGSRWGRSTCSGTRVALAPRAAIRIPTALRSRLQPMEWPMSEMPDGWSVDVDGEKSSSTSRLKTARQSGFSRLGVFLHTLQAVPFRAPSGDFATGVECE